MTSLLAEYKCMLRLMYSITNDCVLPILFPRHFSRLRRMVVTHSLYLRQLPEHNKQLLIANLQIFLTQLCFFIVILMHNIKKY